MTKDDFHKCASNSSKSGTTGDTGQSAQIVSLRSQPQGPRPPMPRAPFGLHIMPVAASVRVLPTLVHPVQTIGPQKPEGAKDEE